MAEEAFESGGIEEAVAEEQSQEEYNNENSKDIREENYREERHPDDRSVKPKAESRLEKNLGKSRTVSKEHNIKEFYDGDIEGLVQDRELTEEEKESLIEQLKGCLKEARYFPAGLNSIDDYIKAWKSQDKATFIDGFKGLGYFIKCFIDIGAEEDKNVYEKIANMKHSPMIYIPGALNIPTNLREIEEASGYRLAHFKDRKNIDELQKLIQYTKQVTGQKAIVIGFSDGVRTIKEYIDKYGMDDVSMFYGLAGSKFDVEDPNKLKFIDGKKDRLFIIEKDAFKKTSSDVFKVNGGHTWTCYDPLTIRQMFDIIERTARVERHNFERFDTKKAA